MQFKWNQKKRNTLADLIELDVLAAIGGTFGILEPKAILNTF